jgi:hypothetical protein
MWSPTLNAKGAFRMGHPRSWMGRPGSWMGFLSLYPRRNGGGLFAPEVGGACEGGLVPEGRLYDMEALACDLCFRKGKEQRGRACDAAADDDLFGMEGHDHIAQDLAEVQTEVLEDFAGVGICRRGGCDGRHFKVAAGASQVFAFDGARGDQVFDGAVAVGIVPYLAAGGHTLTLGDLSAIDGEGAADAGAESEADGAFCAFDCSGADFAEEVRAGIVEEAELIAHPAEALGQGTAEIAAVERGELVLHEAHAGFGIEGEGHGEGCTGDGLLSGCGLDAQPVQEVGECFEGVDASEWSACDSKDSQIGEAA